MTEKLSLPLKSLFSTRVLTIHPAVKWQPIKASLSEVDLADNPRYEALSYTWGLPGNEKEIIIDNVKVLIRHNLWSFLQRVRHQDAARAVWVDALCISQIDLVEKEQQVRMIGRTFKSATRVLVWVGEHEHGSEKLFGSRTLRERLEWSIQPISLRMAVKVSSQGQVPIWQVWRKFLNRPYFMRTWIVQEIVYAKDITIHCGDDVSDWMHLNGSRVTAKDSTNPEGGYENLDQARQLQNWVAAIGHVASLHETRVQWRKTSKLTIHKRE